MSVPSPCDAVRKLSKWIKGTATYYGDENGGGTGGGTCGYGNNYEFGYGMMTAATSYALWYDANICGACFEVQCANPTGCKRGSVMVSVTNLCPGDGGSPCARPKKHLDLAMPAFTKIADKILGHMAIRMRRVPCVKKGNAKVTMSGNPWFLMVMFTNLAGSGDVKSVQIRATGSKTWTWFRRNNGAIWSLENSNPAAFYGRQIDFRIKGAYTSEILLLKRALPQNWAFGGTFETRNNFGMTWR